ncbi:AraC-like DNA-binding protein [Paenibacillus sp. OAS669]|nr:AraC-like DNA-binding protein [Paenibacillus sp. OAS669]
MQMLKCQYPLVILSSIHKRRYPKYHTPQFPAIPADLLCVVTGGKGMVRIQNQMIPLGPNQLFYLKPSMEIEVMLESDYADYYLLMLRPVTVTRQKGEWSCQDSNGTIDLLPTGRLPFQHAKGWIQQVEQLYALSKSGSKTGSLEAHQLFQRLVQELLQELPEQEGTEPSSNGIDESIGYMYKHYSEKIKLDTLADIAGLTRTSYSRSFKKAKGITPVQYLNQIRIESSKELLKQDCSIQEVAESVGFGNEFYFSRMFKRTIGLSPTVYMKRKQLRVGVASCYRYRENLRTLGTEALYEMNGYTIEQLSPEEHRRFVQVQLDALREAQPDIILSDYRHLPFYDRLKDIAPTICLDFTMDWRQNHWRIAELVGREKEARHNFDQMELKVNYAKKVLSQRLGNETLSVMRFYYGKFRVYGMTDHPLNHLLYKELGLKPGSCVPQHERSKEYSMENMPPFETDHLMIYKHHVGPKDEANFAALLAGEEWSTMKAVRNHQIHFTPNWIGKSWSPTGQNEIIDYLLAVYSSVRAYE